MIYQSPRSPAPGATTVPEGPATTADPSKETFVHFSLPFLFGYHHTKHRHLIALVAKLSRVTLILEHTRSFKEMHAQGSVPIAIAYVKRNK